MKELYKRMDKIVKNHLSDGYTKVFNYKVSAMHCIPAYIVRAFVDKHIDISYYNEIQKMFSSFTYFISDGEYIKIGKSKTPGTRLAGLQSSNARELTLEACILGGNNELQTHCDLVDHRHRGEWFKFNEKVQYYLDNLKNKKCIPTLNFDIYDDNIDTASIIEKYIEKSRPILEEKDKVVQGIIEKHRKAVREVILIHEQSQKYKRNKKNKKFVQKAVPNMNVTRFKDGEVYGSGSTSPIKFSQLVKNNCSKKTNLLAEYILEDSTLHDVAAREYNRLAEKHAIDGTIFEYDSLVCEIIESINEILNRMPIDNGSIFTAKGIGAYRGEPVLSETLNKVEPEIVRGEYVVNQDKS